MQWEKPILNQVDFEGSTANNLVDVGRTNCEGMAVIYDEGETDPARRYKGFYWEHGGIDTFIQHEGRTIWGHGDGDGMWMSFSPDGVHGQLGRRDGEDQPEFRHTPRSHLFLLHLNLDARQGYVVVSVADDTGVPLKNYTSQQIVGNQLDAAVKFSHSLEALKGKKVRLQFQIRNASLYSYWFA